MQYTTKTYTYQNAVVRVHTPMLSDQERNRRLKHIKQAAVELLKSKQEVN